MNINNKRDMGYGEAGFNDFTRLSNVYWSSALEFSFLVFETAKRAFIIYAFFFLIQNRQFQENGIYITNLILLAMVTMFVLALIMKIRFVGDDLTLEDEEKEVSIESDEDVYDFFHMMIKDSIVGLVSIFVFLLLGYLLQGVVDSGISTDSQIFLCLSFYIFIAFLSRVSRRGVVLIRKRNQKPKKER